jgi:hypothetical protein
MTIARKGFSGTAVPSSLNGTIAAGATTIVINATTGWPDGTNGKSPAKIDPGLPTEEDILFTSRSGNNLTGVSRAQNGTVAASHTNGAVIIHGWSAGEADELYQHVSDVEATPHSTKLLSPAAHTATLHTVGTTLPALGTAQNLGDTADGSGATLAGGNHAHGFPAAIAYTPAWGGTIGNGTLNGRYIKIGKMLFVEIELSFGSTTIQASGTVQFGLPPGITSSPRFQELPARVNCGASGGLAPAFAEAAANATALSVYTAKANASTPSMGSISGPAGWPGAWGVTDFIVITGWLEIA